MYIIIAIIAFGILIFSHEFGHFITAKLFGVRVNEFSIGMGPLLFKKQGKETLYSLRLLPIGGFCAMEGEDENTGDERCFFCQKKWKRAIILSAGAAMNLLFGFIVVVILFAGVKDFVGTTVESTLPEFKYGGESGIMPGDEIYSINGHRTAYSGDFSTYMGLDSDGIIDLVIKRGGEKIKFEDFELLRHEYTTETGEKALRYGITFNIIPGTFAEHIKYSVYSTWNFARLVWESLAQLLTGRVGLGQMSGIVGVVSTVNDVAQSAETVRYALEDMAYIFAFIAVNLAVMNMLPIPALDGGRVFGLIITAIIEKITGKDLNPKYEGYVHSVGMALLMCAMVLIMVNDVVKIIHG